MNNDKNQLVEYSVIDHNLSLWI